MTLTVTCKLEKTSGSSDLNQQRSYKSVYKVQQTDTGTRASAAAMITAAQALMSGDILPGYGDTYTDGGDTDADSYAQTFDWDQPNPHDRNKLLMVNVGFAPGSGFDPSRLAEPDPSLWPTEYWVEWTEEPTPLRLAENADEMPQIYRPAGTFGPLVNSCGVDFTEPIMRTVYYPVLHCLKYYDDLDDIVALNTTYQETTNNGTFFGAAARKAKYLGTESGRIQKINGVSCYAGITRIWFKNETWDRRILNNGWGYFKKALFSGDEKYIDKDGNGTDASGNIFDGDERPQLFPAMVKSITNPSGSPPFDLEEERSSEPLNLAVDGTYLGNREAVYLTYRYLDEVDYSGIGIGS